METTWYVVYGDASWVRLSAAGPFPAGSDELDAAHREAERQGFEVCALLPEAAWHAMQRGWGLA